TAVVANITKLSSGLESWYDVGAASDKLGHLLDLPLERQTGDSIGGGKRAGDRSQGASVQLANVACSIDGEDGNLDDFTLDVQPGERIALTGAAGGSATLLLDVLYGRREPQSGSVTVDGLDLRQLRLDETRNAFALVHGTEIVEGSLLDNLRFGRKDIGPVEVRDALRDVGLWDEVMALENGLDTDLTTGGRPLTQSQARRLMLARAILSEPRLLLLDGALDSLTPSLRRQALARLFDDRHKWTVLIATNQADVIAACDRTLDCEDGSCRVDFGPPNDATKDGEELS
ncbi:MAG: ATP-binding cassette domain-containing protein, partial [Planctomycetota bacterium]